MSRGKSVIKLLLDSSQYALFAGGGDKYIINHVLLIDIQLFLESTCISEG